MTAEPATDTAEWRRVLVRIAPWVVLAIACLGLLAVDVFPTITNDSIAYLDHSTALLDEGMVRFGYRQFGYPTFLALVDLITQPFGPETLMTAALLQRLLLLAGLAYATWLWRLWAVPLVAFVAVPTFVAYTNLMLTEGLAVPLALLFACVVAHGIRMVTDGRFDRTTVALVTATGVLYLALVAIRFHYVVLGFGVMAVGYALFRGGGRRRTAAMALVGGVAVGGLSMMGLMAVENGREYGVTFPTARGERSIYWAAWTHVFDGPENAENRMNPALADLYADGDAYALTREIEASGDPYSLQSARFNAAINRLIVGTGSTMTAARVDSTAGALVGGRLDDLAAILPAIATTPPDDLTPIIYRNTWVNEYGVEALLDKYNDGDEIGAVVVSHLSPIRSGASYVPALRLGLVIAYVVLAAGLFVGPSRLLAMTGLATALLNAVVVGMNLLDNVRFIIAPNLFVLAIATAVLALAGGHLSSRRTSGGSPESAVES